MFTDQMFSNKVCNYKNVCLINLLSFGFKYRQSSENKSNQAKFNLKNTMFLLCLSVFLRPRPLF